ncbi:MAG: hypothetical protein IJ486_05235, partial [Firmicutes bacterium]|nr:hypothetical protein [Bacillota bacterium]
LEKVEKIGIEKGEFLHLIDQICKKLSKGKSVSVIADELEEDISVVESVCKIAKDFAPDYDSEQIYEALIIKESL